MEGNSIPLEDRNGSNTSLRAPTSQTMNGRDGLNPTPTQADQKEILKRAMSVDTTHPKRCKCDRHILTTMSSTIIGTLEKAFFNVGHYVAKYPVLTIVMSLLLVIICGLLVESFTPAEHVDENWVPFDSRLLDEMDWVEKTFANDVPYVTFLIEDSDVLTPAVFQAMFQYYTESFTFSADGRRFSELCVRTGSDCSVISLLELWDYNSTLINALTKDDIINRLNSTDTTPRSNRAIDTLLGGTNGSSSSFDFVSARATQMTWELTKTYEAASEAFEGRMIDYGLKGHGDIDTTYVYTSNSRDDEANAAIDDDAARLAYGFVIVFAYILSALGRFNLMEQKIYLSLTGLFCVMLSIVVSYGIGPALGVEKTSLQNLLPFLILGIGVDDMFVIVEAWKNLSPEDNELPIPDKIAVCLAHAGVSITVTSVTDVVAFGIGASTVIPALRYFCFLATIGIIALFCLVSTFFVAVLTLDERRRRQNRDACICCYVHPDTYEPNKCSTGRTISQRIFADYYGPFILKKPVKVIIIVLSLVMVSLGMWRFTQIEEDYNPMDWIPRDSYAYDFLNARENLFDRQGLSTNVYCASFDYSAYRSNLDSMYNRMTNSPYIQQGTINSWFTAYHNYLNTSAIDVSSEDEYYHNLFLYLQGDGQIYTSFISWNSTTEPVKILGSYITATHVREEKASDYVDSMDDLRDIVDSAGFPKFSGGGLPEYKCFAYVADYQALEINKVLGEELTRNLILAAVAVLIMTIILVANLRASFLVFICVFFTVVNVGGAVELWGSTIDTALSVLLILCIGLAVDYSAHIAHTFMTVEGTRDERALLTLRNIGPAVLNGGISTLLAFIILADSKSYGFELFFRVFLNVVIFGLFHGLCLLPVMLSIFGPPSYKEAQNACASSIDVSTDNYQNGKAMDDLDKNREMSRPGSGHLHLKLPKINGDKSGPA